MSAPRYQIRLFSASSGASLALFDSASFYDLKYSRTLNDVGRIALTLPGTNQYRPLFALDNFLEVYRTHPDTGQLTREETYLVRLTHRYRQGTDEWFSVGGYSLNHLLARRLVDPADDPAAAGGYSTKAGAADNVIRAYCLEQCGASASALRQFPGLTINPTFSIGASVGARLRYENLLEAIRDLALRGNTDFIIERNPASAALTLTIGVIGANKTKAANYPFAPWVGLTPPRGNLQNPSYQVDRFDEKNFVYALSQGQGEVRQLLAVGGDSVVDSPFNRIEFMMDVRNVEKTDATSLLTQARVAIRDNLPKVEFKYEPTGLEPGNVYRQDWDIGDRVTTFWDEYSQDVRITNVEITVSQAGESIAVAVVRYDT